MAKWSGIIGYSSELDDGNGIVTENIIERKYFGDITKNRRSLQNSSQINDGINISNQISFVSDPYAINNFHLIRYITFMGTKWKVTNAEIEFPRIIVTLGGTYNEESN